MREGWQCHWPGVPNMGLTSHDTAQGWPPSWSCNKREPASLLPCASLANHATDGISSLHADVSLGALKAVIRFVLNWCNVRNGKLHAVPKFITSKLDYLAYSEDHRVGHEFLWLDPYNAADLLASKHTIQTLWCSSSFSTQTEPAIVLIVIICPLKLYLPHYKGALIEPCNKMQAQVQEPNTI